nr:SPASM domain-containing protein [Motilimonas eburnea]
MWSIDTNGDVYGTCDSFVRNFDDKVESIIIGNIAVESVEGIMFGEKHQRLQEVFFNLRNESKCLKCSFYKFCNGGCPVYKSENNSLETFNDKSGYCNYMRKYFSLIENEDVNFFHSAI